MADQYKQYALTTSSGLRGHVLRKARFLDKSEESRIVLDDGRDFVVPSSALEAQADGSFYLDDRRVVTDAPPAPAAPASDSVATIDMARPAPAPLKSQEITLDEQLFTEEVGVERVPVNRIIDHPAETRQEGDILIIPVMEEVLVVQKRILLKEEVRINRSRHQVRQPRRVVLNGESGDVRVIGADGRDV